MKKLTIILAHSNYDSSIANKTIIERVAQEYPQASIRNLKKLYPDYNIDVESEQQNLLMSDIILLQFPVNWYNMPPILKLWFDTVFTYGFAYGETGSKLKEKTLMISVTAGGNKEAYTPIGKMHFRLRQFFNNIECTAYYCGMKYYEPVLGYDNIYIPNVANTPQLVHERACIQADRVIKNINNIMTL